MPWQQLLWRPWLIPLPGNMLSVTTHPMSAQPGQSPHAVICNRKYHINTVISINWLAWQYQCVNLYFLTLNNTEIWDCNNEKILAGDKYNQVYGCTKRFSKTGFKMSLWLQILSNRSRACRHLERGWNNHLGKWAVKQGIALSLKRPQASVHM